MENIILKLAKFTMTAFLIFTAASDSVYAQEGSSANLRLIPSQERIPAADWRINPEYIIPPIVSPPSPPMERRESSPQPAPAPVIRNSPQFNAPLISELERGKWYVQIGAYTRAEHAEDAVKRAGTSDPVVIQNVGTDTNPMFRVLLGPFSQSESKAAMRRFRDKGYEAFLRNGN